MAFADNIGNEYFHILEYYFQKFDQLKLDPTIIFEFSTVLIVAYIIRLGMFISMEKTKDNDSARLKVVNLYIMRHVGIEFIIGYIICYCLLNMTSANVHNIILNAIISPAISFVASIMLDMKCIMPIEKTNMEFGMPDMGFKPKKENNPAPKDEAKSTNTTPASAGSNNDNNNITINVNTGNNTNSNNGSNKEDCGCKNKDGVNNVGSVSRLCYDIINTEDFDKMIIDAINGLIDEQNRRCADMTALVTSINDHIKEVEDKVIGYNEEIDKIKKAELDELKPILKKDIYDSLNKGFVLPADNDRITAEYLTYINLGGNHEVKFLFENHYLKLGVHEDRRKNNISVDNERRNTNPIKYEYGCFDNEYEEEAK